MLVQQRDSDMVSPLTADVWIGRNMYEYVRPDSLLGVWRYINPLVAYLLDTGLK